MTVIYSWKEAAFLFDIKCNAERRNEAGPRDIGPLFLKMGRLQLAAYRRFCMPLYLQNPIICGIRKDRVL